MIYIIAFQNIGHRFLKYNQLLSCCALQLCWQDCLKTFERLPRKLTKIND
jgi:hypothetical protein